MQWSEFIKIGTAAEILGRNSVGLPNDLRYWRIEVQGKMLSAGLCGFPTNEDAQADALEHLFLDHHDAIDGLCRSLIDQGHKPTAEALVKAQNARHERHRAAHNAFAAATNLIRVHQH